MESLTLEQVSYLAEIIGVIVVVISIIYLAIQVRQNTKATQISATQEFVGAYNSFARELAQTEEMADIWIRGNVDFQSLTNSESIRFSALIGQWFRLIASAYTQWQKGAFDNEFWSGIETSLVDTMSATGAKQVWDYRKQWYGNDFQELVNAIVKSDKGCSAMAFIKEST